MIIEGDLNDFDNLCNVVTLYIYDKLIHHLEREALKEKLKEVIAKLSDEDRKLLREHVFNEFRELKTVKRRRRKSN